MKLIQDHTTNELDLKSLVAAELGLEATNVTVEFKVYDTASKLSLTSPNISLDK